MKHKILLNLLIMLFLKSTFCQNKVKIGNQTWMTKNLNVATFRNGDPIPEAKSNEEWEKAGENKQPAWCYYENRAIQNDPENGEKYGKLYNWYAVADARELCPAGWHVPSDDEWTALTNALGGEGVKGTGTKMKSKSGWAENGNGTNTSGFSGLPGGCRWSSGDFYSIGYYGGWWSSTESSAGIVQGAPSAWSRNLLYHRGSVGRNGSDKKDGFSVRCLRD